MAILDYCRQKDDYLTTPAKVVHSAYELSPSSDILRFLSENTKWQPLKVKSASLEKSRILEF